MYLTVNRPTAVAMAATDQAKAGDVTFDVTNSSKETVHEMVVIPFPADGKVPYSDKDAKFDEDAAGHLGEVSELEPGKTGSLRIGDRDNAGSGVVSPVRFVVQTIRFRK